MTASASSYLVARFYAAQIVLLNSNFYPIGTNPALTNGGTSNSYLIPSPVEFKPATPTFERVFSYASEAVRGNREVGVTDFGIGQLTLSEYDETFNQLIGGSTPSVTAASGLVLTGQNVNLKDPPRLGLILSAGATPLSSAENYVNIFLPNVSIRRVWPGTNQGANKNPNNLVYDIVMSVASRTPFGTLMSALVLGLANNSDVQLEMSGPAIQTLTSYIDDGTTTTVTLPYTPYSVEHAGVFNIFTKNGIDAHASVSGISGKTVTITPGSAGDVWELLTLTPYANLVFS